MNSGLRTGSLALLLALAGCRSLPTAGPPPLATGEIAVFELHGRVAVRDGREGGSASLVWRQEGGRYRIEISAPLTRQRWRLVGGEDGVVLSGLPGGDVQGPDAQQLLREATGWNLPVRQMRQWVLGQGGPGPGTGGFESEGWQVEYVRWTEVGGRRLPERMRLSQGDANVRLVVDRWQLD